MYTDMLQWLQHTNSASQISRIWTPSISSAHSSHPPLWNQTWVTAVEHLWTIHCASVALQRSIPWSSRGTTVNWRVNSEKFAWHEWPIHFHDHFLIKLVLKVGRTIRTWGGKICISKFSSYTLHSDCLLIKVCKKFSTTVSLCWRHITEQCC